MEVMRMGRENPLVIFSRSSCCICYSIKTLFLGYGANPRVYELDKIPNGQQLEGELQSMGRMPSVPAVFIGQNFVGGSNEVISLQVRGQLVPMLIEAGAIHIWNRQ